jgi:thioredoxin 1
MTKSFTFFMIISLYLLSGDKLNGHWDHYPYNAQNNLENMKMADLSADLSRDILEVNKDNFELILSSDRLILDVYRENCIMCQNFAPIFESTHEEFGHLFQFARLEIMQNKSFILRLSITNLPTVIYFKNGIEVGRHIGSLHRNQFISEIDNYLND